MQSHPYNAVQEHPGGYISRWPLLPRLPTMPSLLLTLPPVTWTLIVMFTVLPHYNHWMGLSILVLIEMP